MKPTIPIRSYAIAKTIAYDYDHFYRLTAADYSDGTYFHYQYDSVGNREVMTTTGALVGMAF